MLIQFNFGSSITNWNNYSGNPPIGQLIADLLDDTGSATGIAIRSNYANSGSDTADRATQAHHGLPEVFWEGIAFDASEPVEVELSGLTAYSGQAYTITVAGFSKSASVREMNFSVNGGATQSYTSPTTEPPNAPLTFTGTLSGDTLTITSTLVTGLAVMNGFTIEIGATDSITTDGATSPGVTESYTIDSGFASGTPNAGTLTQGTRSITLTGVDGTNFTVPAIADQGAACLFGTDVTCTISNGTEQATDTMTWTPGTGLDYQTLASLSSDSSSLLLAWSGTAEVGGQLVFPDTWTVNDAGEVVSAPQGVETLYYISPSEGANTKFEAFQVTIGADGQVNLMARPISSDVIQSDNIVSSAI